MLSVCAVLTEKQDIDKHKVTEFNHSLVHVIYKTTVQETFVR